MNINFAGAFQSAFIKNGNDVIVAPHQAKPFAQAVGIAPHKVAFAAQLTLPTWSTKDEFLPTESVSSATFKRPVAHKSAPVVNDASSTENIEIETDFKPTFEQPEEMNRLLLAITQIIADNGIELGENDVLSVSLSKDGVFSIITEESSIDGITSEDLNELSEMLSEKLNKSQFEGQALNDAFRQVTEQTKESLLTQYAEHAGIDLEEIKDTSISLSFAFGFNAETEQYEIFGLQFQLLDSLSGQELFSISGQDWTPSAVAPDEPAETPAIEETEKTSPSFSLPTTLNVDRTSIESILSSVIGQTLEANGITLKEGDHIALKLNGKGEFSVDASRTRIDGKQVDDTFTELFAALSDKINEEIGENKAFDSKQFKAFAATMELHFEHIDRDKIKDDPNFSLSFHFRTNSETEEPEVVKTIVLQMGENFHRESFLAVGGISTTDREGNVFIAPGYQQFNKDDLAANFDSEPWNLYNSSARRAAVSQWERDNNFSFSKVRVEGAPPLTPEEKKEYNEMLQKAHSEGIFPLESFQSSLNKIAGTDWMIADGAENLIGHEILGWLENGMLAKSGETGNSYGPVHPRINEYGFAIHMPGLYNGINFMNGMLDLPRINIFEKITESGFLPGMDGGQTYTPEIHFKDALGLGGMNLADRKLFLDMTQKILDNVMPGLDARQLTYSTGYISGNNNLSLTLVDAASLSYEQRNTVEQALNENRQLFEMKHRADQSGNKGFGEFTMSVLDENGNALAKNQVRLIAGNKSITTTIDTIKDMNQQQIFAFINR